MTNSDFSQSPKLLSSDAHHPPQTHVHVMGVGGIGVSAFARLLKAKGYLVSGCDAMDSENLRQLAAEGVGIAFEHSPAHVGEWKDDSGRVWPAPQFLVASEAVAKDHPELQAAAAAGLPILPRMALMHDFLASGFSVGVIGTHGKTTTSSMVAVALHGAGLDPSAFVGGVVPEFGANARAGLGPVVAEIDESDRRFVHLRADLALFTNAEDDHVGGDAATYWNTVEEQHAGFAQFVAASGAVLYCLDWRDHEGKSLDHLVAGAKERLSYGLAAEADYVASFVQPDTSGSDFTISFRGQPLATARVSLPGLHNVQNALGALAVVHRVGGNVQAAADALREFRGPGRRWQIIGEKNGALIVDDYAHNPTKVAAALSAARQTERRVRVIFQPHRYLRTAQSWPRLADALMNADEVHVLDVAAAGEAPIEGIHATLIVDRMRAAGHAGVHHAPDRQLLTERLKSDLAAGDLLVTIGAGDVWKIGREILS